MNLLTCITHTFVLQIDTYSNSTNYQLLNMDRQFSNTDSSIYIELTKFYLQVDVLNILKKI